MKKCQHVLMGIERPYELQSLTCLVGLAEGGFEGCAVGRLVGAGVIGLLVG